MTLHPSTATATARRIGDALQGFSSIARSGFALVLGTLIASVLGMVFWALAARLLTPQQLGIGAALIAAITTLSHASQLNLRNLVHRYVPGAGTHAAKFIYRSYAVAGAMAVLLGAGFAVLAAATAPDLAFLTRSPLAATGFVAALLIWTLYALQEAALTARRLAGVVPLQSLAYSLAKIACLAGIVTVLPTGSAILLAWVAPALVIGLVTHFLMSRQPATASSAPAKPITWRQIASFFGWDYVGALATSISLGVAPLLVVSFSGAADVAPYYLAWSISYMLYLVSRHIGAAMLADLATNAHRRRAVYAEAIVLTLVPVSCGVAVLLLFAPYIMLIFGSGYVEPGADILRVLALASIPGSLVTAYLAICRAEEQVRRIALLQVATLVALLTIGVPLTVVTGPVGMAWGWVGAHSLTALLLVLMLARHGPAGALDFAADLAAATLRLARQLPLSLLRRGAPVNATVEMAGRTWTTEDVGPASLSDATTQVLTSAGPTPLAAILKRASSAEGRQALRREHASLLRLHADEDVSRLLGNLLPEPLHFEDRTQETALLMSRLPGRDARTLAAHPAKLAPVLISIVGTMSALHAAGGTSVAPANWANDWIDAPLARIATATNRHRRCAGIADELRRYWTSTAIRLGRAHGDFCPDNLLVEQDATTGAMRPTGLVDWGGFRPDAPAGFDACTMAMTLRVASSDRQLGQVVLDLLRQPVWTDAERAWMASGAVEPWGTDKRALRPMVLLVWLHHVDANLGKSARYTAGSYWGLVNIRLVLEQSWH